VRCPNCATEIAEGSQFCSRCGAPVAARPPALPLPAQSATQQAGAAVMGQAQAGGGRGMKVVTGVASIAAAGLVVLGCVLPYAKFTLAGHTTSISVFNAGPGSSPNNLWFAAEPIGVAVVGVVCGILLMTIGVGRLRSVVAGILIGFGLQTILLFLGYELGFDFDGYQAGVGGALGLLGGYMLAGIGAVAAASRAGHPPVRAPIAPVTWGTVGSVGDRPAG
jgi:zinc-ribbon domain